MAIGLCLIMGFKIPENFNYPYIAKSVREFWQRWHISLSTWFKNYLYFPLGGNRHGVNRTYVNLIIVFFITGLWHGASYNFIIWGMIHGFYMIVERMFPSVFNAMPKFLKHIYTLFAVGTAWVFFRTENLEHAMHYIVNLFSFINEGDNLALIYLTNYNICLLFVALVFTIPLRKMVAQKTVQMFSENSNIRVFVSNTFYLMLFLYCILEMTTADSQAFIYFKF
jgi:alginate O-acetyltransferase complex protein AlgI